MVELSKSFIKGSKTAFFNLEIKVVLGCNKSLSGDCLPKTQLPANSQEDV